MKLVENEEFQSMVHELLEVLEKYDVSSLSAVIEGDEEHGHLALVLSTSVYPTVAEAQAAVENEADDGEVPSNVTIQ